MRVASDRDGSESTDGESADGGEVSRDGMSAGDGESSRRVHVRRLDVADTLRWSWAALRDRPELVGLALAANLPSVVATLGVTRPSPSEPPAFATWVWVVYLLELLAVLMVGGVVYLSAADAVAYRSRPLAARIGTAGRRLPSLVATGIVLAVAVAATQLPTALVDPSTPTGVAVVLAVLLLVLYVFYRLLLALPACVVDGLGPVASARAGWAAATGIVRKVFAVGVVYVLAGVASAVVSGLFGGEYDAIPTLVGAVIGAVLLPFFGFALAHLYLEGSRNR